MTTILLVEDDADSADIYRTLLEHRGYEVRVATDGEMAIRLARESGVGVILMDMSIPKIDGWEATRILKADSRTAHIPIIALTAHALAEHRERARGAGCDGYLAKPIEPRLVAEEVLRYVEPRAKS